MDVKLTERMRAFAVVICAGCAVAHGAAAQVFDLLGEFDRICLADPAASLAAARALNYVAPPPHMTPAFPTDASADGQQLLWKVFDGALVGVVLSDEPMGRVKGMQGLNGAACTVFSLPQQAGVLERLEAHVGAGPGERTKDGGRLLIYQDADGGHSPVSVPPEEMRGLLEARRIHFLSYSASKDKDGGMTLFILVTPHPK